MRQGVHQRCQAQLELEVAAVDRTVGLLEPPGVLALGLRPAGHAHQHRREALPLQVARVGLGAAPEDAVDVAGGIDLARQARADQGRNVPSDVVPAAALVAGPGDGIALDAGPAHDCPDEWPRVGIAQDALVGRMVRIHGELVALAGPGHVQLLHARAGLADLPGDLVDAVLGPQPGAEAVALETLHDLGQVCVAAAIAVVGQDPATGHVVLAVLAGHALDRVGRLAAGAIAPAVGDGAGLADVVAVVIAIGVAELERPARQQPGVAGQLGVVREHLAQAAADEVVGIEAPLLVLEADLVVHAQVIVAVAPGVA